MAQDYIAAATKVSADLSGVTRQKSGVRLAVFSATSGRVTWLPQTRTSSSLPSYGAFLLVTFFLWLRNADLAELFAQ